MYRDTFGYRKPQALKYDYGIVAALVSCLVIWAGFIWVIWEWAR